MSFKIEISLGNNSPDDVLCVIPQGHIFENKEVGTGHQNVAAAREYRLILPAGSKLSVDIDALCINQSYSPPSGVGNVSVFKIDQPFASQDELWKIMGNPAL